MENETNENSTEISPTATGKLTAELETWKGHSRDWEAKAKANLQELSAVKAELEAMKASATEAATTASDLTTARTELETAKADLSRVSVALEYGLSLADSKLLVGDEATQKALAERLKKGSGPAPDPHQGKTTSATGNSAKQALAALFEG